MSKITMSTKIEEIRNMALVHIPAILKDDKVTYADYKHSRIQLNLNVISVLVGGDLEKTKDGTEWKINFCRRLPNCSELAQIIDIMEKFVRDVENPVREKMANQMVDSSSADMAIPPKSVDGTICDDNCIPVIEKINGKKLKNYIFGYDGKEAISRIGLTASDCMKIAAMGEELRKKTNRNTMFIVGGIALVIVGGVAAAIYINNNKKDDAEIDSMIVDLDDDSSPSIDMDNDDIPTVTID